MEETLTPDDATPGMADRSSLPERDGVAGEVEELQRLLGYTRGSSAMIGVGVELQGLRGVQRVGRVGCLAPLDLLAEFTAPVPLGELVTVRLDGSHNRDATEAFGLVHWQRRVAGRWLIGIFLREWLPESLLQAVWMEMRRELRYPASLALHVRFCHQSVRHPATVRDYSRSGARLETVIGPNCGETLDLLDGERLATGIIQYVQPGPQLGTVVIGCEFQHGEGVRIARQAASHGETPDCHWKMAERWRS